MVDSEEVELIKERSNSSSLSFLYSVQGGCFELGLVESLSLEEFIEIAWLTINNWTHIVGGSS